MKTAVEWLIEQLHSGKELSNVILRAKAMEKEQIIDACNLQRNDYRGMPTYNKSGEQYYNETFKQDKL